jgi:cobalt-zinc-cadmium efflux system protein
MVILRGSLFIEHGMQDHHQHIHYSRAFGIGILLNVAFVVFEAACGIFTGSLALLADAGHNLGDVLGLLLAWTAHLLSTRDSSRRRTYGWKSSTNLAALINAIILLVAVGGIAWEAIRRFGHPQAVSGTAVIYAAALGVVINTATALLFVAEREKDLNIRGAFLHMAADAAVSLGVVVAGIGIFTIGWFWIDPVVSLVIAAIILIGTWRLLVDSLNLVLQAVPPGIDPAAVTDYLQNVAGIVAVHDLHIWAMSTTETALTAHIVKPELENDDGMLMRLGTAPKARFGIGHVTLQVERSTALFEGCGEACPAAQSAASSD